MKGLKPEYFSLRIPIAAPVESILTASAAIPIAFNAVKINGHQYYDGGLCDNVPIRPLYDRGYRQLIVVDFIRPQAAALFQSGVEGFSKVLQFSPEVNSSRICAGYQDAVKCLALFQGETRVDLYERRPMFDVTAFGTTVFLENGLDVTVHGAGIQLLDQKQYVLIDASVKIGMRAEWEGQLSVNGE